MATELANALFECKYKVVYKINQIFCEKNFSEVHFLGGEVWVCFCGRRARCERVDFAETTDEDIAETTAENSLQFKIQKQN